MSDVGGRDGASVLIGDEALNWFVSAYRWAPTALDSYMVAFRNAMDAEGVEARLTPRAVPEPATGQPTRLVLEIARTVDDDRGWVIVDEILEAVDDDLGARTQWIDRADRVGLRRALDRVAVVLGGPPNEPEMVLRIARELGEMQ